MTPWRLLRAAVVLQGAFSVAEMSLPTLTGFIKNDLHLSASTAGFAVSSYLLGKLTTSYLAGRFADGYGEAKILVAGSLGLGALLILAVQASFPLLFVLFGLAGMAGAGATPAGGSLVRNAFPPKSRGLALGLRQTAIPVGGLIAAGLLPWIAHDHGWRWSIRAAAVVCMAGTAPIITWAISRHGDTRDDTTRAPGTARSATRVVTRDVILATSWGRSASSRSSAC